MESENLKIRDVYKIKEQLGRGAFAHVRKTKNRNTGQYYAVKVYSKNSMSDSDKEIMITEIEILK